MSPIFQTPFGFFLQMGASMLIFGFGWWLRGRLDGLNIAIRLLQTHYEQLKTKARSQKHTDHDAFIKTICEASFLKGAIKILRPVADTQDPGEGF